MPGLKPFKYLTPAQQEQVLRGAYRCRPVHPTQLYASIGAVLLGLILYGVWRRSQTAEFAGRHGFLTQPGVTFSVMFILYGIMRFTLEGLRDDNPFETAGLTVSQILGLGLSVLGVILVLLFSRIKPEKLPPTQSK
jgi:prolipoprotein diacylglyceryltransferase